MSEDKITELQSRVGDLETQVVEVTIDRDAHKAVVQSIRKLVDNEMRMGGRCRLCRQEREHVSTCYVFSSTGFDLLDEHEATLRENSDLRMALAKHLPVNGKAIEAGAPYRSHRARLRNRFKRRNT